MKWMTMIKTCVFLMVCILCLQSEASPKAKKQLNMGLYAAELYNIDFLKEQYELQFWLWVVHDDPEYEPWQRVDLINAESYTLLDYYRKTLDSGVYDAMKFNAVFHGDWDITYFPFDHQKFVVEIEDNQESTKSLHLMSDHQSSGVNSKKLPHGWSLKDTKIETIDYAYTTTFGDPSLKGVSPVYSRIVFEIELVRDGLRLFFTLFIGFFISILLTFLVGVVNCSERISSIVDVSELTNISIGALFTAVASIITLSNMLPYTTNLVLSDIIQLVTFLNVVIAIWMTFRTRYIISEYKGVDTLLGFKMNVYRQNLFVMSVWVIILAAFFTSEYMNYIEAQP